METLNIELYTTTEEIDYCDYLPAHINIIPTGFTVEIKGYGDLENIEQDIKTIDDLEKFIKEMKEWKH